MIFSFLKKRKAERNSKIKLTRERSGHFKTESSVLRPESTAGDSRVSRLLPRLPFFHHFSPESEAVSRIANCAKSARVSAASISVFTNQSASPPNPSAHAEEDEELAQRFSDSIGTNTETSQRERQYYGAQGTVRSNPNCEQRRERERERRETRRRVLLVSRSSP